MKLSIWSRWRDESWSGQIPEPEDDTPVLEHVFRFFNRVDQGDHERMALVGYLLPSLSVGDQVTIGDQTWRCANTGWDEISAGKVEPIEHDPDCRRGQDPSGPHYGLDRERCERCRNLWQRLEDVHARRKMDVVR